MKVSVQYRQTAARKMLDMINEFRTGDDAWYWNSSDTSKITLKDLDKLTYDYNLEKIAMQRAAELVLLFSHSRPDGTYCYTATANGVQTWGENIAMGSSVIFDTAEAFEAWQETNESYSGQGHRRNMLSSGYTSIGIACVYYNGCYYWVQEFGSDSGSTATTARNSTKKVTVTLSTSVFSNLSVSADTSKVTCGSSISVPTAIVTVQGYFGDSVQTEAECTWKISSGSSYITLSGDRITGDKTGTTKLKASVLGKTVTAKVTVTSAKNRTLKKSSTFEKLGLKYKVTSISGKSGEVKVTGASSTRATTLTIPATISLNGVKFKVTTISKSAFSGMTKLTSVTIGSNVESIKSKAFYGCKKLSKVTIKTKKLTGSTVGSNAFKGIASNCAFSVPSSKVSAYKKLLKDRGAGSDFTVSKL
ncbi:MAG: CAP domain-containing protein [Lachnospiraceae bacterium]|nr:CAP domain-containing protein [Lachnospiraceae bacterium]